MAGAVLTAAQLNETRDSLKAIGDAWTSYTPTLTQSGAVTKTVTYAKYVLAGKWVTVQIKLAVTGSGTASNAIVIGLPVAGTGAGLPVGSGWVFDSSASALYKGVANLVGTTSLQLYYAADTSQSSLGATGMTAALASGDEVTAFAVYESA